MKNIEKPLSIDELEIFQGLSHEQLSSFIHGAIAKTTRHREPLFLLGEPATFFALVLQGAYKLVRSDAQGVESIIYFAGRGDTIGGLLMTNENASYPITCVSIGKSMVLTVPRETYQNVWAHSAAIQKKMNSILYQRMSRIQDEKAQARLHVSSRVAILLLKLVEKYSHGSDSMVPVPITRQEIADAVGSTVESVIRLMSEWTDLGLIKTEDRRIEVLEIDGLLRIVNRE